MKSARAPGLKADAGARQARNSSVCNDQLRRITRSYCCTYCCIFGTVIRMVVAFTVTGGRQPGADVD